jgi:hypothetical protein
MSDEQKPAGKADKQTPAPAAAGQDKRSPRDWALATGNGPKLDLRNRWSGPGMSSPRGSVEHEVAAVLHGWREHEHETNEPLLMTEADYRAALAASHPADVYLKAGTKDATTDKAEEAARDRDGNPVLHPKHTGVPVPHPAALSPYKGKLGALKLGEKPQAVAS